MKKTILPALAMLIVAAVMLSTASYAWFAMGNEVVAENMNVSVKSDSTYLVIMKDSDYATKTDAQGKVISGYTAQSVDFDAEHKDLYPVAYGYTSSTDGEGKTTYNPTPYAAGTYNFTSDSVWYTMEGTNSANGEGKDGTLTPLAYGDATTDGTVLKDYVLLSSVYVSVSKGSNPMNELKAKIELAGKGGNDPDDAINVLVVTTYNGEVRYQRFQANESGVGYNDASVALADTVTDAPIKVDIYVFYDGTHTTVTTDQYGLGQIFDTSVTVKFTASSSN